MKDDPEKRLWNNMRTSLHRPKKEFVMERMENAAADGQPDVMILRHSQRQRVVFVELKAAKLPKRMLTRVLGNNGLRQSQINWQLRAHSFRLPVFNLIRDDKGGMYLIAGAFADEINDFTKQRLSELSLGSNWAQIFDVLARSAE